MRLSVQTRPAKLRANIIMGLSNRVFMNICSLGFPHMFMWGVNICSWAHEHMLLFYGYSVREFLVFLFLPSLIHITGLKPLFAGHLKDVRDEQCPSRYPHILAHIYSYCIVMWGLEEEKVRETWGRTKDPHVPSALCTSAFEMGHVSMWGTFSTVNKN